MGRHGRKAARDEKAASNTQGAWPRSKGPVLRFVGVAGLLIGMFYAAYVPVSQTPAYGSYLVLWADIGSATLRLLGEDDTVEVADLPSCLGRKVSDVPKHVGRIAATVGLVGIGEQLADVPQRGRSQQGVCHRVQQYVGIAVADRGPIVGYVDPAQP